MNENSLRNPHFYEKRFNLEFLFEKCKLFMRLAHFGCDVHFIILVIIFIFFFLVAIQNSNKTLYSSDKWNAWKNEVRRTKKKWKKMRVNLVHLMESVQRFAISLWNREDAQFQLRAVI